MKLEMSESHATITCEDIFGEESSKYSTSDEEAFSQTAEKPRKPPGTALVRRMRLTYTADQGIILAFKGIYSKFHIRWILGMLDSQVFLNASQARVDVLTAIEWPHTAWDDLSVKTVKNCWNHAKILPAAVVATGPDDDALKELAALLLQLPEVGLRVEDVVDDATERWTAAPIDSEHKDTECKAAMQTAETDEEDADVSEHAVPMTLREARVAAHVLKIFVQENQSIEAFRLFLVHFKRFLRGVDAVTVSARTEQSTIHHFV